MAFVAYHFGAGSDVDAQGRVLMPTELRRKLGMEGEQVHLRCFKQRIEVFGKDVYEQRLAKAMAGLDTKVQGLEKKGCANGYVWTRRPGTIRCCSTSRSNYLAVKPDGIYVDLTAGLGGHTGAIAERLDSGLVIACDRDAESLEMARRNTASVAAEFGFFTDLFRRCRGARG